MRLIWIREKHLLQLRAGNFSPVLEHRARDESKRIVMRLQLNSPKLNPERRNPHRERLAKMKLAKYPPTIANLDLRREIGGIDVVAERIKDARRERLRIDFAEFDFETLAIVLHVKTAMRAGTGL